MANSFIQVPTDSTGKRVDAASLDVATVAVQRQRMVIADDSASAQFAIVTGGALTITGTINISATAQVAIGTPFTVNDISRTVQVAVGTPFTVNNISATVVVSGTVGLTAGSSVIGDLNAISRTVQVAVGTPFTLNNISATVTVAGNINLSATASVILAAGTANIGTLNDISRTVQVAVGTPFTVNNISATVAAAIATATVVTTRQLVGSLGDPSAGAALTVKTAFASITAAGQTAVTAVVSKSIRVLGYRIQSQGTVSLRFIGGSSGAALSQLWSFQAREGTVVNAPFGCFEFQSSAGEGVAVSLSGAVTADISLVYVEV